MRIVKPALSLAALLLAACPVLAQDKVLFDASHRQNGGNADWVIDADGFDLYQEHYPCGLFANESHAQRFPTPDPSGIDETTPETYWTGAFSAFGIDLVRAGYAVESLPVEGSISYGDGGNPQDLSNYDVLVLPEPNAAYGVAERQAILDFVAAGGGLFLIADHQTSDRDCDGADSPHILNDLLGVAISGGVVTDYGVAGIVFNVEEITGLGDVDYWFTDAVDDNVSTDPLDPIIEGPHGSGAGGLGLFGATSMTIDPATNGTVRGHAWKTDAAGQGSTRVTFATAWYMSGRIACLGDSSPGDDGTGDAGDTLYDGWDKATGGVNNKEIHLNAVAWLADALPDTTAPVITSGPFAEPTDCAARITWTTDEPAGGVVDHGPTAAYGSSEHETTFRLSHAIDISGLTAESVWHYRVGSSDAAGNGPTLSSDELLSTAPAQPPQITAGPTVTNLTGTTATVVWITDEPADSVVQYGADAGYGSERSDSQLRTDHAVSLDGLTPSSEVHFRVGSTDGCANGPTLSGDASFVTAAPQIEIAGWSLLQYNSSQAYVFPPGTTIPGNGYLVLARDADLAAFESEWGALPAGTVFLDSGGSFPFINGDESFELIDGAAATVDAETISISAGTTIQRANPGDPPGNPGSWIVQGLAAAGPGSGSGLLSGAGVVINEASDAGTFSREFVELFFDAGPVAPDTISPSDVTDLAADPRSDMVIRLRWTAPGDDASSGSATVYDIRWASAPILSAADFVVAQPLAGAPAPQPAGSAEEWDAGGLSPDTPYYFALVARDEAGNASGLSNGAGGTTGPAGSGSGDPVADHLVISEIQTRGAVDHDDEFVELYNPTGAAADLSGWSIQYKSATGTTYSRFDLPSASVAAGGFFLVARPEYTGGVTPDATQTTFLMGASGGHLFLVDSTTTLTSCTGTSVADRIGWGNADCPEAVASAAHGAGESLERLPGESDPLCGNGVDSDDNGADFSIRTSPAAQNGTSTESPCAGAALGNVGSSMFIDGAGLLEWAAALGAGDYKIRRSTGADFMLTHPVPDDAHLLGRVAGRSYADAEVPAAGVVYHYFVNATDGATAESDD